jgi:predicted nucleic acid-binding protein
MSARAFFDTTMLVYAFADEGNKTTVAEELLSGGGIVSIHVLNEFVAVARRKLDMSWEEISEAVAAIRALCEPPVPITIEIHEEALRIAQRHKYHIYDALVLAAALESNCTLVYSEDMHHSERIGSLTIRNPFR